MSEPSDSAKCFHCGSAATQRLEANLTQTFEGDMAEWLLSGGDTQFTPIALTIHACQAHLAPVEDYLSEKFGVYTRVVLEPIACDDPFHDEGPGEEQESRLGNWAVTSYVCPTCGQGTFSRQDYTHNPDDPVYQRLTQLLG